MTFLQKNFMPFKSRYFYLIVGVCVSEAECMIKSVCVFIGVIKDSATLYKSFAFSCL